MELLNNFGDPRNCGNSRPQEGFLFSSGCHGKVNAQFMLQSFLMSPFIPGLHANYSETKLPIRNGLLKLKNFPTDLVGQELKWSNSFV